MAFDYSRLLSDSEFLSSWEEEYDHNLSLPQNFLIMVKRAIRLPYDHYKIVAAYAMLPSALARVVPYLFLFGASGSGKTTLAKLIASLHGVPTNSATDTFAGIRNTLNERKRRTIIIKRDDPEKLGYAKEVEANTMMVWEDIDPGVFTSKPDIYRLFKVGYDRGSSTIQISSEKAGINLKFDCFCPKIFSSIHPFHTDQNYPEFKRRLLVIPTAKLETIHATAEDLDLDVHTHSWDGFNQLFDEYWDLEKASQYLLTRKEVSKKLRFPSERKIVLVDLITTGLITGIWHNLPEAKYEFEQYYSWLDKASEDDADELYKAVVRLIEQEEDSAKHNITPPKIRTRWLKTTLKVYHENGYLFMPPDYNKVRDILRSKGYKAVQGGYWQKVI